MWGTEPEWIKNALIMRFLSDEDIIPNTTTVENDNSDDDDAATSQKKRHLTHIFVCG